MIVPIYPVTWVVGAADCPQWLLRRSSFVGQYRIEQVPAGYSQPCNPRLNSCDLKIWHSPFTLVGLLGYSALSRVLLCFCKHRSQASSTLDVVPWKTVLHMCRTCQVNITHVRATEILWFFLWYVALLMLQSMIRVAQSNSRQGDVRCPCEKLLVRFRINHYTRHDFWKTAQTWFIKVGERKWFSAGADLITAWARTPGGNSAGVSSAKSGVRCQQKQLPYFLSHAT